MFRMNSTERNVDAALLSNTYCRSQMHLSEQLAQLHPELTMPMFSEITHRFQTARPEVRQILLQYLLPWLHNMELLDPNVPPANPLSYYQYCSNDVTRPGCRREGWGSVEATEMVLNNLFYITAKYCSNDVTRPGCRREGWGSVEATEMVLNNLFYITAKMHLSEQLAQLHPELTMPMFSGLSCGSRHYAGRSLQIFRALRVPINSRMLTDILSRLVETVAETGEDMQRTCKSDSAAIRNSKFVPPRGSDKIRTASGPAIMSEEMFTPPDMEFRCNVAVMLLTDLVVDYIEMDWSIHLPLMLHILFLGLDHSRSLVLEHCKQCLLNLLLVLCEPCDQLTVAQILLNTNTRKLQLGLSTPPTHVTQHNFTDPDPEFDRYLSASSDHIVSTPTPNKPDPPPLIVVPEDEVTQPKSIALNPDVKNLDIQHVITSLVEFLSSKHNQVLWPYEDITAKVWTIRSGEQLDIFLRHVLRLFRESLPHALISERWAQTALQLAAELRARGVGVSPGDLEARCGGTASPSAKYSPSLARSRSAQSLKLLGDSTSADDKMTILAQLFWLSVSLLESDYEHEYLLALRLLARVLHRLPLDRPDARDKVDKLQVQLKPSSAWPGVHSLLLKGCTSPNTYEAVVPLLSQFTPLLELPVVDATQSIAFPMNVIALLPYMLLHYEDANELCIMSAENIAQLSAEKGKKLENLGTVMTLYSRRTFSKESFQWTKCVVKYLYDSYSHLSMTMLTFLVERTVELTRIKGPRVNQRVVSSRRRTMEFTIDLSQTPVIGRKSVKPATSESEGSTSTIPASPRRSVSLSPGDSINITGWKRPWMSQGRRVHPQYQSHILFQDIVRKTVALTRDATHNLSELGSIASPLTSHFSSLVESLASLVADVPLIYFNPEVINLPPEPLKFGLLQMKEHTDTLLDRNDQAAECVDGLRAVLKLQTLGDEGGESGGGRSHEEPIVEVGRSLYKLYFQLMLLLESANKMIALVVNTARSSQLQDISSEVIIMRQSLLRAQEDMGIPTPTPQPPLPLGVTETEGVILEYLSQSKWGDALTFTRTHRLSTLSHVLQRLSTLYVYDPRQSGRLPCQVGRIGVRDQGSAQMFCQCTPFTSPAYPVLERPRLAKVLNGNVFVVTEKDLDVFVVTEKDLGHVLSNLMEGLMQVLTAVSSIEGNVSTTSTKHSSHLSTRC
ncbi:protein furry-like [Diaphorina citri]|uniref:Protein furry-like n=1 Tax=Diaphorina citri TaxID=121845 RepID=A0A3Q0IVH1_DIACI|nr:protein furry-like [Diaphorina citri]